MKGGVLTDAHKKGYVTMTHFWAYHLFEQLLGVNGVQEREPTTILEGGCLLQQLAVDCWASAEQLSLRWLWTHQATIQSELYQGLADALQYDNLNPNKIGQCIVLPSSFTGSDCYMSQLYQDSMAIAQEYGPATYFITVTASPCWEKLQPALLHGQETSDHPDLVVRVFHRKLTLLLNHLKSIFGKQMACVHVIEFNKQGLPNSHILLWIKPECQPHSAEAMDKVCSFFQLKATQYHSH